MTSSVEDDVFAQHVIEAGFLWILRDQATKDPAYDLSRLAELDDRVEANIDGLRLAGDRGWDHAIAAVEDGEAGELFTATTLAVGRADLAGIARILDAMEGSATLARGVISGLGWSTLEEIRAMIPALLDPTSPPELHYLGIAGCAIHREDPGQYLNMAAGSESPRVRARAFVAAAELGRSDVLPAMIAEHAASDADVRYAAAYAGTVFGDSASRAVLLSFAQAEGPRAEEAADLLARALEPRQAVDHIRSLARSPSSIRSAIRGALALGDPSLVGWLIECMEMEDVSRPASWAVATLMGLDLITSRARLAPPPNNKQGPNSDPADPNVAMDADESLVWPNAVVLKKIWAREQGRFQRGKRYLLGREVTPAQLSRALHEGVQPIRRGAALDLALCSSSRRLFQTAAPGFRQRSLLQ